MVALVTVRRAQSPVRPCVRDAAQAQGRTWPRGPAPLGSPPPAVATFRMPTMCSISGSPELCGEREGLLQLQRFMLPCLLTDRFVRVDRQVHVCSLPRRLAGPARSLESRGGQTLLAMCSALFFPRLSSLVSSVTFVCM